MGVADRREFVRLDVGYVDNPKVADVLDRSHAAVVLHLAAICYSRQHRTDGVVPIERLARKVGATLDDVATLASARLIEQGDDGSTVVHDYLKHQESAEKIAQLSEAGRKAGKRSAESRRERAAATDGSTNRSTNRSTEGEGEGEKRDALRASPRARRAGGDPTHLLLSGHGLDETARAEFLAHLAAAGVRAPSVLVSKLHQTGDLARRIEQWRIDTEAATNARAAPTGKRTTDDRVRDGLALAARLAAEEAQVIPIREIGDGA